MQQPDRQNDYCLIHNNQCGCSEQWSDDVGKYYEATAK